VIESNSDPGDTQTPSNTEAIDVSLPGPYKVGRYAYALKDQLRSFQKVQLIGEVWNVRSSRAKIYFELRDSEGAVPCSMWLNDWDKSGISQTLLVDGAQVVIAGCCDYYPGSSSSSPTFSFLISKLRLAGTGDLLMQLEKLRKKLQAEGLFEYQKRLNTPYLPKTIGVVTGRDSKAQGDIVAGLKRRGWGGTVIWGFAPVQDRHAAPKISKTLQDLAAIESVEAVVVARGGGSLADLFAFCDETLCRTVAMLRIPVITSVGHHTDRTLIDDVAAVSCSTPTHAASEVVKVDIEELQTNLYQAAERLKFHSQRSIINRAVLLRRLARAPAAHIRTLRSKLHQSIREIRASSMRRTLTEQSGVSRFALVLTRKQSATYNQITNSLAKRISRYSSDLARSAKSNHYQKRLDRLAATVKLHEPEQTLRRGYALVKDQSGKLVTSKVAASSAKQIELQFRDGSLKAEIELDK